MGLGQKESWTLASGPSMGLRPGLDTSHLTPAGSRCWALLGPAAFPKGHPEPASHSARQRSELRAKGALSAKGTLHWPRRPNLPQASAPIGAPGPFQPSPGQGPMKPLLLPPN